MSKGSGDFPVIEDKDMAMDPYKGVFRIQDASVYITRLPVAAPAANTSPGDQGDWAYDGTYMYWCVAANTWVRWIPIRVFS